MHWEIKVLNLMNKLILIVITVGFTSLSFAQQGVVSIEQDPKISKLLEVYKTVNSNREFYTIQVGFGSYKEAENLKQDVEIDFPQWKAKIVFDSPTYRVRVGSFKTKLEAERNFLELREKYPQSLILKTEKTERN